MGTFGGVQTRSAGYKKPAYRDKIDSKCKDCIYDPYQKGNWREQTAACASSSCALHEVRPVPGSCRKDGQIDRDAVNAIRRKIGAD